MISEDYIPTLLGYVFLYDLSPHLQILPIYVVLLIFIPTMVAVCAVAGPFYLFLLSFIIWFFAQLGFLDFRMGSYNFYSWQVLFVFGFSIGVMKTSESLYINSKFIRLAVFTMFLAFLLYRYQENILEALSISVMDFSYVDKLFSKRDLGPLRLMNFVVISYVIYYFSGRYSWLFRSVVLERIGRKSLEIFTFQIFLVFALSAFSIDLYFEKFYVNAGLTAALLVSLYCYARYAGKYQ
ncbi:hypothetical protein LH51_03880 [Nitrincola sp. A-D6]|nr:hypothetical protein LH51_03880 [Nitrincola sp. A-D6]